MRFWNPFQEAVTLPRCQYIAATLCIWRLSSPSATRGDRDPNTIVSPVPSPNFSFRDVQLTKFRNSENSPTDCLESQPSTFVAVCSHFLQMTSHAVSFKFCLFLRRCFLRNPISDLRVSVRPSPDQNINITLQYYRHYVTKFRACGLRHFAI